MIDPHKLTHLDRLEAESIHIFREVAAEFQHPVMLYSIGKDSSVLLHLLRKAFFPAKPPIPLLHVDTTWKFREMIAFRDSLPQRYGFDVKVHINPDGVRQGISPITHGATVHTDVMKTQALNQALDLYRFDAAIGGARRDEEKSRAKERVFSFRSSGHRWDPKNQRPELWGLYNTRVHQGESVRVFPLSNWTELDIWLYIYRERIEVLLDVGSFEEWDMSKKDVFSGKGEALGGLSLNTYYLVPGDIICIMDDPKTIHACSILKEGTTKVEINSSGNGFIK